MWSPRTAFFSVSLGKHINPGYCSPWQKLVLLVTECFYRLLNRSGGFLEDSRISQAMFLVTEREIW